jgi:hypothetical protein
LFALLLAVFLYINTFSDARTFFAGHPESPLIKYPWLFVAAAALLGAGILAKYRWMVVLWLPIATVVTFLIRSDRFEWGRLTAFALCLPGWMVLAATVPQFWRATAKPAGELKLWIRAGLLAAGAAVISSVSHAIYLLRLAPNLNLDARQSSYVVARVAAVTSLAGLSAIIPFLGLCVSVHSRRQGSRLLLLMLGRGVWGAMLLILINGIRRLDGWYPKPSHFAFASAVAVPMVVFFLNRVATIRPTVAQGLTDFGQRIPPVTPATTALTIVAGDASKRAAEVRHRLFSMFNPLLWLGALISAHLFIGKALLYYSWGSVTGLFYGGIAIGLTWYLLTRLSLRLQNALGAVLLMLAAAGLLTLLPRGNEPALWAGYLKFDQNLGAAVKTYYELHPSHDPEVARIRERILAGRAEAVGRDLRQWHMQELLRSNPGSRSWVFFIVADALRHDTYSGSTAERQMFPGMDWMAERFVIYDNTWTSYNGTSGSLPAYLNGLLHPAWYRTTAEDHVQHDNLLVRACRLENYSCYNFSGYMREFRSFWPVESTVPIPDCGIGLGDPSILFPLALRTVDQHRADDAGAPAFFYVHLYNLHQPLLQRPGVPLEGGGLHWMRELYDHNARFFDQQLLLFLKGLEERGLLKQSLVIVTADHGEEFLDLGGLYHGWHINPTVMHVPLFVHFPATQTNAPPPGTLSPRVVNLIDLAPTICETMAVSIRRESSLQGLSLLSPNEPPNRAILLLNWCSPIVGELSFSPAQMRVLNCESGAMDVFEPGAHGWQLQTHSSEPRKFAPSVGAELEELFQFWHEDRAGSEMSRAMTGM